MALIGRFVEKLLKKGSITLIAPGKPPATYGPGGGKHLTVRFTDRMVGFDILKLVSTAHEVPRVEYVGFVGLMVSAILLYRDRRDSHPG